MRGFAVLAVFLIGAFSGVLWTVSVVPGLSVADVFGDSALTSRLGDQMEAMGRAGTGIMIGLMWGAFGLVIAFVASTLFGGLGRAFDTKDRD